MDLAQMTGAGGTLTLGGRTFLLRVLTFEDRAQLREHLKAKAPRPMATLAQSLAGPDWEPLRKANPEEYKRLTEVLSGIALKEQQAGILSESALMGAMDSDDTGAFMLWLRLRKDAPDLKSPEDVLKLLQNEDPKELNRKMAELRAAEEERAIAAETARKAAGIPDPPKPAA